MFINSFVIYLLLFYCKISSGDDLSKTFSNDRLERIINGVEAKEKEFPFLALLYKQISTKGIYVICGGTIISEKWVLTAAHCLNGRVLELQVIVGEINRHEISIENVRDAVETYVYPKFDLNTLLHDIGVLKVDRPFYFDEYVQTAKLPPKNYNVPSFFELYMMGWGVKSLHDFSSLSIKLNKLKVLSRPTDDCDIPNHFNQHYLCTVNEGSGPCMGDSGGPLVSHGFALGIISYGPTYCAAVGTPVYHVNIAHYVDWIKNITKI